MMLTIDLVDAGRMLRAMSRALSVSAFLASAEGARALDMIGFSLPSISSTLFE
jgi:hypothetical protein